MATYNGTNGNNTITGSSSSDTMNGLDGNDVLNGGAGNDTIDGGNNDDTLIGGTGNDKLYGRDGDDNLDGGDGDDRLDGGNGRDVITGGAGKDIVYGGDGEDTIDGDDGNDTLDGGASQDVLRGGAGNDSVKGGDGDDKLFGGVGNDSLDGGTGQDVIYGDYDPASPLAGQSATVTFNSESADNKNTLGYYEIDGAGNIVGVKFIFANASASGSGGSLTSGATATVSAAAGNSLGFFIVSNGFAANSSYSSFNLTTGHLEFRNSDGSPATTASTAPQLYYVNASGVATAIAGATYHAAAGSEGAPLALNADGKDHATEVANSNGTTTLKFEDLNNLGDADFNDLVITVSADVTASGAANYNDNISGGDGDDKIDGQFGNDNIEGGQGQDEIYGGEGNDSIDGDQGDDRIYGGAGNDTLRGDDNNDRLFGEDGNDNIFGGTGDDQMDGGAGHDVVKGDDGNDIATYVASENVGSHDVYEGNKGWDTLKLVLTQAQYTSASVQQDLANYQAFLANNSNPNISGGPTFHFNSFDLDVRTFENLQVVVVAPPNSAPDAVNDAAAVTEDQYGIVNVLSNDSTGGDVGDSLTVSGVAATSSLGVALSVNANGTVNYNAAGSAYLQTLKAGQTITDSFTYTVTDQGGLTDTATVTVTITGVNDAPTVAAMIADMTVAEDAAFTLATAGNFADIDVGDTRTYSATLANGNPLPSWLTINATTGVISGTPANGDVGAIAVKVTMTDGSGATANDTFNLTVSNTNDGPTVAVAIPDTATPEDALFTFATAGNFADVDVGDTRAYSATLSNGDPLPSWLSINAATGVLSGTPANGDVGAISVKVTMTDGAGASANDTFNLTVANVNDTPVVTVLIPDQSAAENAPFSYDTSSNFTDDDFIHGDSLTYTATLANGDPLPPWLTIDPNTGVISGTPPDVGAGSGLSGTVTFVGETAGYRNTLGSYEIDGAGNISAVKFVWDNSSRAGDGGSLVGGVSTAPVSAAPGNTLGFFLIGNGYDVNGQYAGLDLNAGHLEFRDSSGNPATTSTVNPQLWYVGTSGSQQIGGDIYHSAANNALNADGLDHTEETALGGVVVQIGFEDLNGLGDQDFDDTIFNLQLSGGATSYEIVVTATDESGASASDSFVLTIENVNDAPVVTVSIPDQTTPEDALFTYETSANFSDDDAGDSLSYTATLANGDPLPAWLSINSTTGQLFGTPANGDVGGISVLVTATDESGESVSDVFDLTVTNVNDAPVVSVLLPNQGMAEDVPFSFNATGYFTDVDLGDSLTYSATLLNGDPLPSWLSIDPVTGILSGTPANGDVGNIGVVITVTDESGAHTSDAFGLTVTNVNDVPVVTVAVPDQVTNEDAAFSYNAAANFADVDVGDALHYTATLANGDPLPAWLSFNGATGVFSGTPTNGDVGALSITVTAIDNSNTSVSDTFVLTVANVNDAPVVTVGIADQAVAEDASFSLDVSGNFDDIDLGDVLSYSATLANGDPLPAWLSINGATGQIFGTPTNGDVGAISVLVTATDLAGATASDTFDLTVANVNDVPVVTVAIPDQTTDEDAAFSYDASANFDDIDAGDVLTYTATLANGDPLPSWLSIDANTGVLSGTPTNGDVGGLSLIVSATDGSGATVSDAFDLTVENVNDTPVVTVGIADASTNEDAAFSYDASANFADDDTIHGDELSYSATLANGDPLPAWLSIDPVTGELSGTPANGDVGAISIIVTATDLAGATAADTFDLTVVNTNDGPVVAVAIADQTTDEDAAFSLDVSGNFADVDLGDVLTYSATLANGDPLPAWLSINAATGELSGTPANGDVGAISVLVTATDLSGATASDVFDLTVENVNDTPVITVGIADAASDEDAAFSYDASANFADDDTIHGDVLSYSATLANGDPLPAWLSIDPVTGELSGTPGNGDVGTLSIVVTATDLAGATANDAFDLTITNTNDGPVVTVAIADTATAEDAPFSLDISGNFADVDLGDVLSYSATLANGDPLPAWLSINPSTGEFSGTPANGDVGGYSITVTATDGSGATATDSFDLTVTNVNDAPVVTVGIADATTNEDAAFSYDAAANFADDDTIHGDVLSYSATLANGDPLPAWLSINSVTGELSGTPANGDVGAISILVTATDLAGATASDIFDLTVANTNDGPTVTIAIADQTTDEDAAFSLDVSGNFADVDLGDVLSYSATLANGDPLPAWLSIDPVSGELSGTPANGDVGAISILVTATDLAGSTASDTFDLTVENVNDAPVVTLGIADAATDEDAAFSYDASANFADDDSIHGDVLSYSATLANGDPLPAWLSINGATGELSGTPANGDVGVYSIIVTATDLAGATASDTFDLSVANVNDTPVVTIGIADQTTDEDAAFSLDVSGNFADVDLGDVLSFSATLSNGDPLPSWLSIDPVSGELSGTPANGDVGAISVLVTATDLSGATASDVFDLTVTNVNDAPVVTVALADLSTDEDAAFTLDASTSFADDDTIHGDVLSYTATLANGDPLPAWLSINAATGELSGTPANGDVGAISILVTATDLAGATASDIFDLTIVNTNDGPTVSLAIPDQVTPEDAGFSFDVSGNFADVDLGDVLTFTATLANGDPLPSWLSFNSATGTFSGTPDNWDVGSLSVLVTASDVAGATAADTFDLTVTNVNDAPVVTVALADQTVVEDAPFSYDTSAHFGDDDFIHGDSLTYTATLANGDPLPAWLSINPTTGVISGLLAHGAVGGDSFQNGTPSNNTINGNALNNTIDAGAGADTVNAGAGNDDITAGSGNDTVYGGTGNDLIDGGSGTDSIEGGAGNDNITGGSGNDTIYGDYESLIASGSPLVITVTATDESGATASDTFDLKFPANDDTIDAGSGSDYVDGGQGDDVVIHRVGENVGASDVYTGNTGHDTLRLVLTSAEAADSQIQQDIAAYQAFLLTHSDPNSDSGDSFQFTAFDLQVSNFENLEVVVEDTNTAPVVATPIADTATDEDAGFSYDVSGNFYDPDFADPLLYSAVLANGDPLPAWLSIDANNGTLSGTPDNDDVGLLAVVVTVTDSFGESASDTFNLSVVNVNDAPVVTVALADTALAEDAAFSYDASGAFADDDSIHGDVLHYSATLANGDPLPSWLHIDANTGVMSGTPVNGDVGGLSVTVTATDLAGAHASDTFALTVTNTNDAPTGNPGIAFVTTNEDAAFSYGTAGRFSDIDVGDVLTYSAVLAGNQPLPSWLHIDSVTGVLSGTPGNDDVSHSIADGNIIITATDTSGATASTQIIISVLNVNDAPTVTVMPTDEMIAEDAPFTYDFSAHFADVDIIHGDSLTYSLTIDGNLADDFDPQTGIFSGTPQNADVGAHVFVVTATDESGASVSFTYTVTVTNVNDAPVMTVAIADQTTAEDALFSLDVSGNFADADLGDSLTYAATLSNGDPLPAWLSINPTTGELSGTPANGDVGAISIIVTATDLAGATASDTFDLTVENVNDAPVVTVGIADAATDEDAAFSLDVSGNFADVDLGDVLSYSATLSNGDPLPAWLSIDPVTGELSGTPENGDVGAYSVTVTATDLAGATASDTFDLTVNNTNDGPTVDVGSSDLVGAVQEDGVIVISGDLVANDPDLGDVLTWTLPDATHQAGTAFAALDRLSITVNGEFVFQDNFDDGIAPPNAPDFDNGQPASYYLGGADEVFQEAGGRAIMDGTFGGEIMNTSGLIGHVATVRTDVDPGSPDGLKVTNDFRVAATYDLVIPNVTDEGYGLRLRDNNLTSGYPQDDLTQIMIRRGTSGNLLIQFSGAPSIVLNESSLSSFDQIRFTLEHDADNPGLIQGYYSFLNDGVAVEVHSVPGIGHMFSNEAWVTAQVFSQSQPDPLASTIEGEYGNLTLNQDGHWDYALDNGMPNVQALASGETVVDSFTVQVTDAAGATATQTINVTVTGTNDAPIVTAAIVDAATNEDAAFSYDASVAFGDVDNGDVLTYSATLSNGDPLPAWLSIDPVTGELSGTPANGDVGLLSILVTATDLAGATTSDSFELTITNVNDTPVVSIAIADQTTDEDALFSLDVSGNFADVDLGDVLTYSATLANGDPLPAWLSINAATGELSGTPENGDVGVISVLVTATDSEGATASDTFDLTVENVNDAPVVTLAVDDQIATQDAAFSYDSSGNFADVDLGDVLSYAATLANGDPLPAWLSINPTTGELSGTPTNGDVGLLSILVTATDLAGATASDVFDLTIDNENDVPTVTVAIADQTTDEDALFSLDVSGNFADVDLGDVLTFSATLANGDPLPAWLSIDPVTGELSGTPENGDVGVISVLVTATDSEGATASDTFDLTVINVNDAPVVSVGIPDLNALEDAPFSLDAASHFDDVDLGDELSYTASLANGDPLPAWLSFDGNTGTFSGTPTSGFVGVISLVVTATDLAGASVTEGFDITVENVNDAPTLTAAIPDQVADEDASFVYDLSPHFADADIEFGDSLGFDAVLYSATLPNGDPLPGWLSINPATGELFGTPSNEDVGVMTVVITATDSASESVSTSFTLTVANVNDAPVVLFEADPLSTNEGEEFGYSMADHFDDADFIHGDVLTYTATLANGDPLPAWLSLNPATGEIVGTPSNGDLGTLSILVTVTDVAGETASTTLELTIDNVNETPTVVSAIVDQITDEDAPFSLDVSGNFADVDLGDELTYTATLANGDPLPAWLSIDPVTGELSGTPENGDVGAISVIVTVTDLAGATASDEFAITVLNTNDGPVATVDAVAATEDVAITYLAADLLANDSDIDVGDVLTISGVSNAVGGTVELTVDGDVLFTPTANFSGAASFDYTVADGNGGFSTATVTVAVAAVADAPIVTAEDVIAAEVPAPVPNFEGGDEFFANDTTAGNQVVPSVLGLANGNFVTVWSSVDAQDGDYSGVFAKIYAPDGSSVTAEFQVNTFTSSDQLSRSVTSLANGDFVITWTSGGQDGDSWGIYGQRFTVDGTPVGGEFAINTETSGSQESPTVTSLADGGFLIAWQSYSGSQDGSGSGIYAQRFDAASSPVGSEFIVNTTTANNQALPVAAGLADGGYVVAWQSEGSQDGWSLGIYAQRYDAAGNAVGGEFQVNSFWIGDQSVPSITALASGGFVVTWQADGYSWAPNQDADNWGIYSRVYDANGNALTGEILVNSTTENQQIQPSVTALADGGYFVSWSSFNTVNGTWDVYGQRFDAAAHKVGDELLINSTTDGTQWQPSVTTLANGSLVVSWYDYGHDGSGAGIATRIFTLEDTGATIAVAGLDIQAALADLDGSESILSVLISDLPAGATLSAGTDNHDGTWSLTPAQLAGLEISMPVIPPATYSLTVAVTSIEGANGDTATTTITFNLTVPDFNHAPIVTFAIADQTIAQEDAFSLDVSGNFADSDLGDVLTYSATLANGDPLPAWLSINPTTGELSGTPANGDVGAISVTVTATDEGGLSASDTLDVTVTNVNDTPVVTVEIADQATAEDALFSLDVSGNFADADIGDVLTYSITGFHGDPLPSWISIDANTGVISGTPDNGDVGSFTVEVSATDASGAFVRESFILTVENVNDAPVVTLLVADGSVDAGELFSRDLSAHFADDDSIHGDVLTYAATLANGDPLPAWLSIDPNSGIISGTPGLGDIGAISIIVTVTDIAGATASDMFDLAVTDINTPPVLTAALADQATDEDALFAYDLSGNFADSDLGDVLTYTATLANGDPLPSWLSIDANTGVISGVPSNTDVTTAPISILVTVTDLDGLNASDTFDLTVANVNDAPVVTVGLGNENTWVNAPFTYETAGSFADVDGIHGDTLTFSATLNNGDPLPSWLTIDPQTGLLSGTPIFGNTGTLAVTVTATDLAGATASDTFNLTVTPVETDGGTPSQLINTYFIDNQLLPDVTTLTNGDVVLVWSSLGQDGSSWGVYGQRVEQDGTPVGSEFHINTTTIDSQIDPSITELSDGGFMVTWTSFGQDGNDYGIYGQRFDAEGSMVGSEFHINTAVVGDQDISSITTLSDGGFVVTWNSLDADTHGVFGQKFDADANPIGGEFQINTTTAGNQDSAEVAGLNNGGFVVVWNANATDGGITQDGWGGSVQLRIFGADGNPVSGEIQANSYYAFEQINPSVAVLDDGSFVVVWQSINQDGNSWGIFGQHFAADGSKIDAEFAVNTTTDGQQVKPAIGSLPDGGFVVTWTSIDQDGDAGGIYGQRFDVDGNKVGAERRVNDVTANDQINSVVTGLQNGGYAVAYDSYGQEPIIDGIDDSYGVFLRFFYDTPVNPDNDAPIVIAPIADQSYMEGDAVSFDVSGSFEDPNVGDLLVFTAAQADGSPLPTWLTLNPTTGGFSGTPPDGGDNVYHIVVTATDAYGATVTETFDLTVGNANPGDAMLVNDTTYSDQLQPSLAALADGNSVVVWSSLGQDGDSWGVFMKIYAPDGSSLSNELQVNTFDSGDQQVPTVTALAAGGFVVTWASFAQDGSAYGVYGQMFAADGTPQGSEFLVNSATTGNQDLPVVTALDDGGFIVAWQSNSDQDGSGFGIYSQRYDASGVAVGGETLVNSTTAGSQQLPSIASLNDGGYIVAWQSDSNQDGWASGIYTQRYDASGVAVGGETLVNSFWVHAQTNASVSALASGGYVVTWQSESQGWFPTEDGDNWGVFAKVYDANGVALTGDVLVNTTTADQQLEPSVTGLPDGGFYVTWTSYGQDGDGAGIYGQQFDAAGNKVGGETLINDLVNGQQLDSAVTLLANGDISVTWTDVPNDGSGYGVFSKIIDITPNPLPSAFGSGDDVTDFNLIPAGTYDEASMYNSGDGNDTVTLPYDFSDAAFAGFVINTAYDSDSAHAFNAGAGDDTVTGSGWSDFLFGGDGADYMDGNGALSGVSDFIWLGANDGDQDVVAFHPGSFQGVVVIDFVIGEDKIDVSDFGFSSFAELQSGLTFTGDYNLHLLIHSGQSGLTLQGISELTQLTEDDFIF